MSSTPKFPTAFIETVIQTKKPDQYINFKSVLKSWNEQYQTTIQYQSFIRWIMVMQQQAYLERFAKNTYRILRPLPSLQEVRQLEQELLQP
jgi:hypothetical protein